MAVSEKAATSSSVARGEVLYLLGFRSAAVVTDEGSIIPGALVENVSLGLAMCAAAAVDGPTEQHRLADLLPRGPHKS